MDFAGTLLTGESTETSPFLIDNGYTPRTSFDWKTDKWGYHRYHNPAITAAVTGNMGLGTAAIPNCTGTSTVECKSQQARDKL